MADDQIVIPAQIVPPGITGNGDGETGGDYDPPIPQSDVLDLVSDLASKLNTTDFTGETVREALATLGGSAGQVLKFTGSDLEVDFLEIDEIPGLETALEAKEDVITTLSKAKGGFGASIAAVGNGVLKFVGGALQAFTHLALADGGTNTDLSATGPGFLKQATLGSNITVTPLSATEIAVALGYADEAELLAAIEAGGTLILSGSGAPDSGDGADGDFYYRTSNSQFYGPKTAGSWGSGVSLIGATGATGAAGSTGATGATGATGPAGPVIALSSVSGTNTITATATGVTLAAGMLIGLTPTGTNTGATTLNINSGGAINVRRYDGSTALASGDLASGKSYLLLYDGTVFRLLGIPDSCMRQGTNNVQTSLIYGLSALEIGPQSDSLSIAIFGSLNAHGTCAELSIWGNSNSSYLGAMKQKCAGITRPSDGTWTNAYSLADGAHHGDFYVYDSLGDGYAEIPINSTTLGTIVDGASGVTHVAAGSAGASNVAWRINSGWLQINVGTSVTASTKFGIIFTGMVV